jgi:hypothetical protein
MARSFGLIRDRPEWREVKANFGPTLAQGFMFREMAVNLPPPVRRLIFATGKGV